MAGRLGEAFGFPAAVAGGAESTGGVAFGGVGVAASASFEVTSRPLEDGEADLRRSEFCSPVGWDGSLRRLPLGFEAGEAEGFSSGGGAVVALDVEGVGGGRAGIDGPTGSAVG